ncbi:MAG: glycosyltransferase family 2 protein [Thermodesulfobacteriota bacterium]
MTTQPPPPENPLLTVAVIAFNEADRIGRLLKTCDSLGVEILVVDSGSSDGTVEVCREHGAKVMHQTWRGYAAQKQFALETARGEWILSLDADEAPSAQAIAEILSAVKNAAPDVAGFSMPRMSRYLNRWIRHGGWYPDRKVRLVRRGMGRWVGEGVHEGLHVEGNVVKLSQPLLHYVYRDIADQVKTINRFSTVTADYRRRGASMWYVWWGIVHAAAKFLECAVWKLGILDGVPGLIIAVNSAFYVFLKHAKAWEKGLPRDHGSSDGRGPA